MNILITGGAGYVGSTIARLALENNYCIRVVDCLWFDAGIPLAYRSNPDYEFIRGDFAQEGLLDKCLKDIDIVIHTAAVVGEPASKKFAQLTRETNLEASLKLIAAARRLSVKGIVFFSTCSNYGIAEGRATEDSPLQPLSLYAETKVRVERHLMEKTKDLDWVICRLSTVYGASARMRFDLTVNDFTLNAFRKKYLDLFLPYTFRPYIHVLDVARVILKVVEDFDRVKNNVFNVGFNGENYQKIKIAETVKQFLPETKIELVKRGTDTRDYQVDFSKLQKFIKIENKFNVAAGVEEVLALLQSKAIADPYMPCYYNTQPNLG